MPSDVNIANLALTHVGGDRITSLEDANETARTVNSVFVTVREALIADHPWTFAMKETSLALSDDVTPLFEFNNAFQMPSDFLGFPVAETKSIKYEIVGNFLYTDDDTFKLKYLANIKDPNLFDASFVETFALKLAWTIAYAIAKKNTVKESMATAVIASLNKARHANSIQSTPKTLRESSWILSRLTSK